MGRHIRGFTMVEMAIVLVIVGVIASVLVPTIYKSVQQGKITAGREVLEEVKKQVVGYAIQTERLPSDTDTDYGASIFNTRDPWGRKLDYHPATAMMDAAGAGYELCDQSNATSADLEVTLPGGSTVSNVAFALVSRGPDHTADITFAAPILDLSGKDDDLAVWVNFYQLYRLVCGGTTVGQGGPSQVTDTAFASGSGWPSDAVVQGSSSGDYTGMTAGDVTIDETNYTDYLADVDTGDGENYTLKAVARHGGSGWQLALRYDSSTPGGTVASENYSWPNDDADFKDFSLEFNTAGDQKVTFTFDGTELEYTLFAPDPNTTRYVGNFFIEAKLVGSDGRIEFQDLSLDGQLLSEDDRDFTLDGTAGDYQYLASQKDEATQSLTVEGSVAMSWSGSPGDEFGFELYFYAFDVPD
jgi:prepilin-type N-terminal cleavage/methylation domain-containing protein